METIGPSQYKIQKKKSVEYLFDQIWVREFILSGSRAIFIVLY